MAGRKPLPTHLKLVKGTARSHRMNKSEPKPVVATPQPTLTTRFVIRWSKTVTDFNTKDRLVCEGLEYGVVGVKELGRRQYLEITAAARSDLFNPTPEP